MKSLFEELRIYKKLYSINSKELEYIIGCHSGWCIYYVKFIIKGRFELGEEIIYKNLSFRRNYKTFFKLD